MMMISLRINSNLVLMMMQNKKTDGEHPFFLLKTF